MQETGDFQSNSKEKAEQYRERIEAHKID